MYDSNYSSTGLQYKCTRTVHCTWFLECCVKIRDIQCIRSTTGTSSTVAVVKLLPDTVTPPAYWIWSVEVWAVSKYSSNCTLLPTVDAGTAATSNG
jgi:hypothetical protein